MTRANYEIKMTAYSNGVRLYQIAKHLGKSESWLNRKLRHNLSETERLMLLKAIREIANQNEEISSLTADTVLNEDNSIDNSRR